MAQLDYIKDIAKYGLENDQERLLSVLNELIEHSKKTKKLNFAIQLQSILKDSLRFQKTNGLTKVGSESYLNRIEDKEISELILEKITSDYTLDNIIANEKIYNELKFFIEEHQRIEILQQFSLPVSNKLLLYGPSGCGKTLASYVIAGELHKMMIVINLGAIVSSKLGETSKNLSKIFKKEKYPLTPHNWYIIISLLLLSLAIGLIVFGINFRYRIRHDASIYQMLLTLNIERSGISVCYFQHLYLMEIHLRPKSGFSGLGTSNQQI